MPVIEGGSSLEFDAAQIKQTLNQVLFTASSDEARPVLTGVYMSSTGKQIFVAATDSYRLAEKTLDATANAMNLLIPAQSLSELVRAMKDDDGKVQVDGDHRRRGGIEPDIVVPLTFEAAKATHLHGQDVVLDHAIHWLRQPR